MLNIDPQSPNFEYEIQLWWAEAVTAEEKEALDAFLNEVECWKEEEAHFAEDAHLDHYYESQWEIDY